MQRILNFGTIRKLLFAGLGLLIASQSFLERNWIGLVAGLALITLGAFGPS